LYQDEAEQALERLLGQWRQVYAAQLFRIGVLKIQFFHLRAGVQAEVSARLEARGEGSKARRLRQETRGLTRGLMADGLPRARALALLVDAALDASEGDVSKASRRLEAAIVAFDEQQMQLFAAAARCRLGALVGGPRGQQLLANAGAAFEREGVVNPERTVQMLAPGFQHALARVTRAAARA
jgi:hypothetical protein